MTFDADTLATLKSSMERCRKDPNFLKLFYKKFIAAHPEVRSKFSNTHMAHQIEMLQASLSMIMLWAEGHEAALKYLELIAQRHSKADLDIEPELYDLWLISLMDAVKETDPACTLKVEMAWNRIMTHGVEFMRSRYEDEA